MLISMTVRLPASTECGPGLAPEAHPVLLQLGRAPPPYLTHSRRERCFIDGCDIAQGSGWWSVEVDTGGVQHLSFEPLIELILRVDKLAEGATNISALEEDDEQFTSGSSAEPTLL